jgi:membrane protein YdbS with pleckstrin-like domain
MTDAPDDTGAATATPAPLEERLATAGVHLAQLTRVHPNAMRLDALARWIATGVVGAATLLPLGIGALIGWPDALPVRIGFLAGAVAMVAILALFARFMPRRVYDATRYRIDAQGIEIRHGVWWKRVVNVPRSRIQHTDVAQGPLGRRYGIARLLIHTAGTVNANVELDGLARGTALLVRAYLLGAEAPDET